MANYRVLLISVLVLSGCTSDPVKQVRTLAGLKPAAGPLADCSENGNVLSCDWNNATDDWLHADPSEFSDTPPAQNQYDHGTSTPMR
ncbi:hypothetical protein [Enterobacter cloacae complex sp. ESBL7]|uniref:hypothetical protein n=1 Tax=Enterobacter cloacae complex sp. ESBL7 TaxID=3163325 RepID=UPI0035690B05